MKRKKDFRIAGLAVALVFLVLALVFIRACHRGGDPQNTDEPVTMRSLERSPPASDTAAVALLLTR